MKLRLITTLDEFNSKCFFFSSRDLQYTCCTRLTPLLCELIYEECSICKLAFHMLRLVGSLLQNVQNLGSVQQYVHKISSLRQLQVYTLAALSQIILNLCIFSSR